MTHLDPVPGMARPKARPDRPYAGSMGLSVLFPISAPDRADHRRQLVGGPSSSSFSSSTGEPRRDACR